jgi:hypothetical protein
LQGHILSTAGDYIRLDFLLRNQIGRVDKACTIDIAILIYEKMKKVQKKSEKKGMLIV